MDRRDFVKKSKYIYFDCGDKHADFERKVFDDFLATKNDKLIITLKDEWFMNESDNYNQHHIKFKENMNNILPLLSNFIGFNPDMNLFNENKIDDMVSYFSCNDDKCKFTIDDGKEIYKGGFEILVGHTFPKGRSRMFTYYHQQFSFTHTSVSIVNENIYSKRILLMSYDSYMAPFIPILAYYFKKIVLLDYDRKYDTIYKTVDEFIGDDEITDFVIEMSPRHRLTHFLNESFLTKPFIIATEITSKEELLDKSKYILFDVGNTQSDEDKKYIEYIKEKKDGYIIYDRNKNNRFVDKNGKSECYFTYLKNYGVQGIFSNICNFLSVNYNPEDFRDENLDLYDEEELMYMLPYIDKSFIVEAHFKQYKGNFSSLIGFTSEYNLGDQDYQAQFAFANHNCKITNLGQNNGRTLLLSCDSYMIPFIPVLSYYFYKIIILNNNNNNNLENSEDYKDLIKGEKITDIIIAISTQTPISHFIKENFSERYKEVGIYCGLNWGVKWDEKSLYTKRGLGGSETWAVQLANALQEKGYNVTIYGEPENNHTALNGVKYKECGAFWGEDNGKYFDHFISSRITEPVCDKLNCNDVYLMSHDTVFSDAKEMKYLPLDRIKKIVALSKWHGDVLKYVYEGLGDKHLSFNFNGVDDKLYQDVDNVTKVNSMVWSSRSERGLKFFLSKVFPLIRKEIPDFTLYVALYDSLNNNFPKEYENIEGIIPLGSIDKNKLSNLQKKSKIWIYPNLGYYDDLTTRFHETFCITAVENAFAKNALLTLNIGGLATTLRGYHGFLEGDFINKDEDKIILEKIDEYAKKLASESIKILKNEEYRKFLADNAYEICKKYTWNNVADKWIRLWKDDKPENLKILGVTFTFNEEKRIPYVMPYYQRIGIDKLIVYDNESTDNTVEILKQYPFIEIRQNITNGACDNTRLTYLKNEGWKEYKDDYDWCIVADFDEVLYSERNFRDILFEQERNGKYTYRRTMINLFFEEFPDLTKNNFVHKLAKYGQPWIYGTNLYISEMPYGDKTLLFCLNEVKEINYGFGAHSCYPNGGRVSHFSEDIETYHLKYIDKNFIIEDSESKFQRQLAKGGRDTGRYSISNSIEKINKVYEEMNNFKVKLEDYSDILIDGSYYPIDLIIVTRLKNLSNLKQLSTSIYENICKFKDINLRWFIFKNEEIESDAIYKNIGKLKWITNIYIDYYNDDYFYHYNVNEYIFNNLKKRDPWILLLNEEDMVHFNLPFVIRESIAKNGNVKKITIRALNGDGTTSIENDIIFKHSTLKNKVKEDEIVYSDDLRECKKRCSYLKNIVRSKHDFYYDNERLERCEMTLAIQSEWDIPANTYRIPNKLKKEIFSKIREFYETR